MLSARYAPPAAATLMVALGLAAAGRTFLPTAPMDRLARAAGPRRFFEARLSGSFRHGPRVGAKRAGEASDKERWSLAAAAAELAARAEKDPSTETSRALAGAHLFLGGTDQAVRLLEALVQEEPRNARLQCDLGAAYLTRAETPGHADDPPKALEAALTALQLAPASREALFNKALALAAMNLRAPADEAWQAYEAAFPDDEWLPAVHEHRETLRAQSRAPAGEATSVQEMRRKVEDELLGRWAACASAGDAAGAQQQLADARRLAAEYRSRTADALLAESTAALDVAGRTAELAAGHGAYAAGLEASRRDSWTAAREAFVTAERRLRAAGSPFARWATLQKAICAYYLGRHADALRELDGAVRGAPAEYRALRARALWVFGLVHYVDGRPFEGSLAHRESVALFAALGEEENAAFVHSLLGNDWAALGRTADAWSEWTAALRFSDAVEEPRRVHLLFWSMARASQPTLPRVALCLARQMVRQIRSHAAAASDDAVLASALVELARMADAADAADEVPADLTEAERLVASGPADMRPALEADLAFVRGQALSRNDPERAVVALSSALEFYRTVDERFDRAALLTQRARLLAGLGRDADALADSAEGLSDLRRAAAQLPPGSSRLKLAAQADRLATQLIQALVRAQRPGQALLALEEVRALAHGGRAGDAWTRRFRSLDEMSRRIPNGMLIVEFVIVDRDVAVWALSRDLQRFELQPGAADALRREVQRFRSEIVNLASGARAAAELHRRLFGWLEATLERYDSVIVVPDGALFGVPFGMLVESSGQRMGARHAVCLAPSLFHVLRRSAPRARGARSAAVIVGEAGETLHSLGLPPLPAALPEGRAVAALHAGSRVFESTEADGVGRVLEGSDVIHFAGHALKNLGAPELDALVLPGRHGRPTLVYARDVERLTLRPGTVVVLAACRTGANASDSRVMAPGLAQALLDAGASAVVAALWDVDDRASERVMPRLHRELAAGTPVERALQAALAEDNVNGGTAAGGLVAYVADRAEADAAEPRI
jgi:CHAT domain-containing protein